MDHRITKLVKLISDNKRSVQSEFNTWKASLQGEINFEGVEFPEMNLRDAHFEGLVLTRATFQKTQLRSANFEGVTLTGACFVEVDAPSIQFPNATLCEVTFDGGNLADAIFNNTELRGAKFLGPDLSGAQFITADISQADISPRKVNSGTLFVKMRGVEGCQIDRHTLASLEGYGGLTQGDRMLMNIRSDVARLRFAYSGFQQWLHLFALLVFGFPYVWFLVKSWAVARFIEGGQDRIAIWEAFIRYIVTGGEGWREGWSLNVYSFGLFLLALVYNVLRLVLLLKTKQLELKESISGLPVLFSLHGRWHFLYQVARIGFWVNLGIVILHTIYFLQMTIPIG